MGAQRPILTKKETYTLRHGCTETHTHKEGKLIPYVIGLGQLTSKDHEITGMKMRLTTDSLLGSSSSQMSVHVDWNDRFSNVSFFIQLLNQ